MNTKSLFAAILVVLTLMVSGASAFWGEGGVGLRVYYGSQSPRMIAPDGAGGAVVTWVEDNAWSPRGVYVQKLSAQGVVQWGPAGVVVGSDPSFDFDPQIVADGAGGVIVAWCDARSGNKDIYAQRVNASGIAQWTANGVALGAAVDDQWEPRIASDGAGGAIVLWNDTRNGATSVLYGQRVDASGTVRWTPNGVAVTPLTYQVDARVVTDGAGGVIAVWRDPTDIYAQRLDSSGVLQWNPAGAAVCMAYGLKSQACVTTDGAGGAIVAWMDDRSGQHAVYAQRMSANGSAQWTTDGVNQCVSSGVEYNPQIASDNAGGAIVIWRDSRGGGQVYAQRAGPSGSLLWAADGVGLSTVGEPTNKSRLVVDNAGSAVITWQAFSHVIKAQKLDAAGVLQWPETGIVLSSTTPNAVAPVIAPDGAGGAIIAWMDLRNDDGDIYAQRLTTGLATFTDAGAGLAGLEPGAAAWGDCNNDGRLDILVNGATDAGVSVSRVYRQNANGSFTDLNAGLTGLQLGGAAWGDYDNDGDLDILQTGTVGSPTYAMYTLLHRNNGNGTFTAVATGLPGLYQSSVAWGDADNDGDLDILITGTTGATRMSRVYRNDGNGSFVDFNCGLVGVANGKAIWGDYDGDGDLDILLAGYSATGPVTRVYRNDGPPVFTDIGAGLPGVSACGLDWGDCDGDGAPDILLTGQAAAGRVTAVYRNAGGGVFANLGVSLPGLNSGSAAWGDCDNDGRPDILLAGYTGTVRLVGAYRNLGNGTFEDFNAGFPGITGLGVWGDCDNDGDLDVLVAGYTGSGNLLRVYHNDGVPPNAGPVAPAGLSSQRVGNQLLLSWGSASDDHTPASALSYNLRVGTSSRGGQIVPPLADPTTSRRLVARVGNAQQRLSWTVNLPTGVDVCYWSVQAVDGTFLGGPFAPEVRVAAGAAISWANLQGPSSLVVAAGTESDPVYGQVRIDGLTNQPGAAPGLVAELGYGPDGSNPSAKDVAWQWTAAIFNQDVGDNDEFVARLTVAAPGAYDYAYRYAYLSEPWVYGDLDGSQNGYSPSQTGGATVGQASDVVAGLPTVLRLHPNHPNPFNPLTTIIFDLPGEGHVRLTIYDVAGRLVRTLVDDSMPRGSHEAVWDGRDSRGRDVASGGYVARLEFGGTVETIRMGLVR